MNTGAKSVMIGVLGMLAGAGGAVLATGQVPGNAAVGQMDRAAIEKIEIGRASCRERVCMLV